MARVGLETFRIARSRIFLPVCPTTATCTTFMEFFIPYKMFCLCRLAQSFSLPGFNFHPDGPDKIQEFASHRRDHLPTVLAPRREFPIALCKRCCAFQAISLIS
jgi:hypothetical protein